MGNIISAENRSNLLSRAKPGNPASNYINVIYILFSLYSVVEGTSSLLYSINIITFNKLQILIIVIIITIPPVPESTGSEAQVDLRGQPTGVCKRGATTHPLGSHCRGHRATHFH